MLNPPYRSFFHAVGEEPRAGGPAQHLPGRVRGGGGGDGGVLRCDDRKGAVASGSGRGGGSQAVGGQQQAGGSGGGRTTEAPDRGPEQSCPAGPHTAERTERRCGS